MNPIEDVFTICKCGWHGTMSERNNQLFDTEHFLSHCPKCGRMSYSVPSAKELQKIKKRSEITTLKLI